MLYSEGHRYLNIQLLLMRELVRTFTPWKVEYSLPRSLSQIPLSHCPTNHFRRALQFSWPRYPVPGELGPPARALINLWRLCAGSVYVITRSECLTINFSEGLSPHCKGLLQPPSVGFVGLALGTLAVMPSPRLSLQPGQLSVSHIFASCCHRSPLCQC